MTHYLVFLALAILLMNYGEAMVARIPAVIGRHSIVISACLFSFVMVQIPVVIALRWIYWEARTFETWFDTIWEIELFVVCFAIPLIILRGMGIFIPQPAEQKSDA